jgi:prepilin-type N-terminal cleavage/methylation domain-containing protein/prepilin-type processing-associated H-X9-DG protein
MRTELPFIKLRKCRNIGFTLVELLVVISIIALLLSILMPSLQSARQQAYRVVCTANMKQMGLMLNLYSQDNKGCLPPGYAYLPPKGDFVSRGNLPWHRYLGDAKFWNKDGKHVFLCKSDVSAGFPDSEKVSYKANFDFMPWYKYAPASGTTFKYLKMRNPSSKLALVEGRAAVVRNNVNTALVWMQYFNAILPPDGSDPRGIGLDNRHKRSSNYLWMDWHVSNAKSPPDPIFWKQ